MIVSFAINKHAEEGLAGNTAEKSGGCSRIQVERSRLEPGGDLCAHDARGARWQLTARILAVAYMGHMADDLRQRARSTLEALRDESGESVLLAVQDILGFFVSEVVESRHMPRIVPPIGITVPVRGTAAARAMLPYMTEERQSQLLGRPPDPVLLDVFARRRMRRYSQETPRLA